MFLPCLFAPSALTLLFGVRSPLFGCRYRFVPLVAFQCLFVPLVALLFVWFATELAFWRKSFRAIGLLNCGCMWVNFGLCRWGVQLCLSPLRIVPGFAGPIQSTTLSL